MPSLEEFLTPGSVEKLTAMIDEEKIRCATLAQKARAPKPKAKKKGDSDETHKAKMAEAHAEAKQAKQKLAELSQELVPRLVKTIESEKMLKPALSVHPTSDTGSGNTGVPDVVPCFPTQLR